jgi:hypothetical protein
MVPYARIKLKANKQTLFFFHILVFCFLPKDLFSQEINEIELYFSQNKISSENRLYQLVYEQAPTISVIDSQKTYPVEKYPQKLFLDVISLNQLFVEDQKYRTVKIIQLHIKSDLEKSSIKLEKEMLKDFINLECILIQSDIQITHSEISKMVLDLDDKEILILYQFLSPQ